MNMFSGVATRSSHRCRRAHTHRTHNTTRRHAARRHMRVRVRRRLSLARSIPERDGHPRLHEHHRRVVRIGQRSSARAACRAAQRRHSTAPHSTAQHDVESSPSAPRKVPCTPAQRRQHSPSRAAVVKKPPPPAPRSSRRDRSASTVEMHACRKKQGKKPTA